jgi:hypothetical protein
MADFEIYFMTRRYKRELRSDGFAAISPNQLTR